MERKLWMGWAGPIGPECLGQRRSHWRFLAALCLTLGIFLALRPAQADSPPLRIASINVCADQLLLALADPDQIATLSIFAADAGLSFLAEAAKRFPHKAASAESVIGFRPDLVLAGSFTKLATRQILRRLGFSVLELQPVRSVESSLAEIRQLAALLGHADRGEKLIAEIEAAQREAVSAGNAGNRPSVAVYQRRGYVTGGNTLTGDLMAIAGFFNQGASLAGRTGGFVPLEKLLTAPPDLLLVNSPSPSAQDEGSALLSHPALLALFPPERRIVVPDRLTVCGGPSLPDSLRHFAAEARRVQNLSRS